MVHRAWDLPERAVHECLDRLISCVLFAGTVLDEFHANKIINPTTIYTFIQPPLFLFAIFPIHKQSMNSLFPDFLGHLQKPIKIVVRTALHTAFLLSREVFILNVDAFLKADVRSVRY